MGLRCRLSDCNAQIRAIWGATVPVPGRSWLPHRFQRPTRVILGQRRRVIGATVPIERLQCPNTLTQLLGTVAPRSRGLGIEIGGATSYGLTPAPLSQNHAYWALQSLNRHRCPNYSAPWPKLLAFLGIAITRRACLDMILIHIQI